MSSGLELTVIPDGSTDSGMQKINTNTLEEFPLDVTERDVCRRSERRHAAG
jgi:hypothetical protein